MSSKLSLDECVFICLSTRDVNGRYIRWTYWDIGKEIHANTGSYYNDNSISCSIRNMRKPERRHKFGLKPHGEVVEKCRRTSGEGWEYYLTSDAIKGETNAIR